MKNTVYICLMVILPSITSALDRVASKMNAPPTFLQPADLNNPKALIKKGTRKERENSLVCTALNADDVYWTYSEQIDGRYGNLPDVMAQWDIKQDEDNLALSRTITDRDGMQTDRYKLNGYYKCTAKNKAGFTVETPPIRLIIPVMRYKRGREVPSPKEAIVNIFSPYRMTCLDTSQVEFLPDDFFNWNLATFKWVKSFAAESMTIENDERVRMNPQNGDLFFTHVVTSDKTRKSDANVEEYECSATIWETPGAKVVSRNHLEIMATEEKADVFIAYPSSAGEDQVTCIDGEQCKLTCIYGGRDWGVNRNPPVPVWTQPGGEEWTSVEKDGNTIEFTAFQGAAGVWTCGADTYPSAQITVNVLMYPKILEDSMADQFVTIGEEAVFDCSSLYSSPKDDGKTTFYVNGVEVTEGKPSFVSHFPGQTKITIPSAQREHSSSVTCIVYNKAGVSYKATELNVYEKANFTFFPEDGLVVKNDTSKEDLIFECIAVVDEKVIAAEIYWRSNHSSVGGEQIKDGDIPVSITKTSFTDRTVRSELQFNLDTDSQTTLFGAVWWCEVEMFFEGRSKPETAFSRYVPLKSEKPVSRPKTALAGFNDWWIIGVIAAVCFFILIIVLIVCCMRHHKGEQYYVDEKERKAGHNPEEEMAIYGFSDYKRSPTGGYMPMSISDQDPVKGSRTSLDRSDKPMESDSDGMDEYGDIDPCRFNEDGSFIGQYGKASSPMEV